MSKFPELLDRASAQERVVGVILGGSRGKGLETDQSDWDVYVVVNDPADVEQVRAELGAVSHPVDLVAVLPLGALSEPDGIPEWNRYNFAHLTPVLDRTEGRLQRMCDELEWLPEDVATAQTSIWLEAYINSYYRSLKNLRDGHRAASALDAAESVNYLLELVFTAERRIRPYNKFLEWELSRHPLERAWWPAPGPVAAVCEVVSTGSLASQSAIFRNVETQVRQLGHGDQVDGWGTWAVTSMRDGACA